MREYEQQGRGGDHADHHGAHAAHGPLDQAVVFEPQEEARHEDHQRERRQADGEGGHERSRDAVGGAHLRPDGVAHVGRRVDGYGPRGDLRHGHDIGELGVGHPGVAHDHLVLYEREHGVAAAEAEETDLEVAEEELEQEHDRVEVKSDKVKSEKLKMAG